MNPLSTEVTQSETPFRRTRKRKSVLAKVFAHREVGTLAAVLVGAAFLSIASGNFLNPANLNALILGLSFNAIVAVGMTILMVSGGFDLSVGSTLAVAGAVAGTALAKWDTGVPVAILAGLTSGAIMGLVNGLIIAEIGVNPLIATLGMMQIGRGVVLLLTSGYGIPNLPDSFTVLAQGKLLDIQYPVWIMLALIVVVDILLRRWRFFRQSYFVGGNERSARLSGIRVRQVKVWNYIITALAASIAGVLLAARFGSASVSAGVGVELQVIAAVIIGGASLAGGEGTVLGSLFGVTLMALIANGLNLLGVNVYWQTIVIGAVLIIAVAADAIGRRNEAS
jgi:ribose transport system permease protein